jgi:5-methylcytosine-specific restriction endonuclease McrA
VKTCELCRHEFADASFTKSDGKISRACAACRKKRQQRHIKDFYKGLTPDKRNTLTMRRRAKSYGVRSEPYSRTTILARWGNSCAYCGSRAAHLDHVHPLSRGGEDIESNILPACEHCNLSKGAKSLAEWVESWPTA